MDQQTKCIATVPTDAKLLECILISIIGISFVVQKEYTQADTLRVLLKARAVASSTLISLIDNINN